MRARMHMREFWEKGATILHPLHPPHPMNLHPRLKRIGQHGKKNSRHSTMLVNQVEMTHGLARRQAGAGWAG